MTLADISKGIHAKTYWIAKILTLMVITCFSIYDVRAGNFNQKKVKVDNVRIPTYFFSDSLSDPLCYSSGLYDWDNPYKNDLESPLYQDLIGFDWQSYHEAYSSSLTVQHDAISGPMRNLLAVAHKAIFLRDEDQLNSLEKYLVALAEAETLMDTITISEAEAMGSCWNGKNKENSACHYHAPQYAAIWSAHYTIVAKILAPHLSQTANVKIASYAKSLYERFGQPYFLNTTNKKKGGYYEMADGAINALAYASLVNDEQLAKKIFATALQEIDERINSEGLIRQNSLRGVRGLWYHSLGLNGMLAVAFLADVWQVKIPAHVLKKLKKATTHASKTITDYNYYERLLAKKGMSYNSSTSKSNERSHLHQLAIGIDVLALRVTNDKLPADVRYISLRKSEGPTDWLIGFNPRCGIPKTEWIEYDIEKIEMDALRKKIESRMKRPK